MRNILLVAKREIDTTVRTKAFLISAILVAVILSGVVVAYGTLGTSGMESLASGIAGDQVKIQTQAQEEVLQSMGSSTTDFQTKVLAQAQEIAAQAGSTATDPQSHFYIGYTVGILIYILIMVGGSLLAKSVAEEKASSIAEVLLATMKPIQLLTGKILGVVVSTLIQIAIFAVPPLICAVYFNIIPQLPIIDFGPFLILSALFVIIGYLSYSALFAACASLIRRATDVNNVQTPMIIVSVIGYMLSLMSTSGSPLSFVSQYVPLLSPFGVPVAFARGDMDLTGGIISLAISVVFLPMILWFAGKIYSNSILNSGVSFNLKYFVNAVKAK